MKYALVYGLIAGLIAILIMITSFALSGAGGVVHSLWYGYLVILVGLSFIFVGVKRYRDVECGGVIRFGQAFLVGIGIAALASLTYVAIWEIYLAATEYEFLANMVAAADGPQQRAEMGAMLYNPIVRVPFEFLEPFPVGLVMALLSALLVRNPRLLPATQH